MFPPTVTYTGVPFSERARLYFESLGVNIRGASILSNECANGEWGRRIVYVSGDDLKFVTDSSATTTIMGTLAPVLA